MAEGLVIEARIIRSVSMMVSSVMGMGGIVTASEGTSSMRVVEAMGEERGGGREMRYAPFSGQESERAPCQAPSFPFSQHKKHVTGQSHVLFRWCVAIEHLCVWPAKVWGPLQSGHTMVNECLGHLPTECPSLKQQVHWTKVGQLSNFCAWV